MQRVLLLDNYDSFTYNLAHYLSSLDVKVDVFRNDLNIPNLEVYDKVVLSPGSGLPADANNMMDLIERLENKVPVLGVCLGMQAIAEHFGGGLYNQNEVKHGVEEIIYLHDSPLFKGLERKINVGLYHSWSVQQGQGNFEIIAESSTGVIMALQNIEHKMYGVQFHPESIMTPEGARIIQNFLDLEQ